MANLHSAANFAEAAQSVLAFLHDRLGFALWMVTRTEQDQWIVLQTEDHGYGVKTGDLFRWTDSFCSRMVRGEGPRVAPRSDQVDAYRAAPINQAVNIGAYIGVPLAYADGQLFGTLCAIDPDPQSDQITQELPLIELMADLLSRLLQADLALEQETRSRERAQLEADTDALTGLYNRRGWNKVLTLEEQRCRNYGHSAGVISLDLNDLKPINDTLGHSAGDNLLQATAQVLRRESRSEDCVARIGGDEFSILVINADAQSTSALVERLKAALIMVGISASLGSGVRHPAFGLAGACEAADRGMYLNKQQHKRRRLPPIPSST